MTVTTLPVPKKSKEPTAPVRIRDDLARKVAVICARRDIGSAEFLDPTIRPFIEDEFRKVAEDISHEAHGGNGKHKKKKAD